MIENVIITDVEEEQVVAEQATDPDEEQIVAEQAQPRQPEGTGAVCSMSWLLQSLMCWEQPCLHVQMVVT